MAKKLPLTLVTGFLGSGKTSFLVNYLAEYSPERKIAIVQNEFAQSDIDSEVLRDENDDFVLRELNKGSIFCRCLFSSFLDTLVELSENEEVDAVLIEATGIADPIAIAQVFEDKRINERYYLQKIITIVDASRFLNVLENIVAVRHQVEVADYILVNKTDLADGQQLERIHDNIKALNPFGKILMSSHGDFNPAELSENDIEILACAGKIGDLTRCGQGNYVSGIFKRDIIIPRANVDKFLSSLDDDILRLKGYVTCEDGKCYMVQYVPGQLEVKPCQHKVGKIEIVSIGFKEPDFILLLK